MKFDITNEVIDNDEFMVVRALEVLSDEAYDKIKPDVETLGGHWRERVKGFCFSRESLKRLQYSQWQESIQFFPTPIEVARRVYELSEISSANEESVSILEPSAGQGGLINAVDKKLWDKITCIEPDETNSGVLLELGLNPHKTTFEEFNEKYSGEKFSHVIMNPPFSLGRDISHVKMAYDLLKDDGTLVAIISENTLYYERQANRDFVKWLEDVNAYREAVPTGSFIDCGTAIDTVIIKIKKSVK